MKLKYLNKKIIPLLVVFIFFLSGCKDNNPVNNPPCGGIDPGIVPEPAFDSPIWHPTGNFIGFNHVPLDSISYPYGQGCWGEQNFNRDSAGFWLINPDGTNMRRIFPYTLQDPAWSPDGNWIAFVAGAQIYKMRFTGATFDTTTLVQLTTEGRNFFPAWSPDGKVIVHDRTYTYPESQSVQGIWLLNSSDGSNRKKVSTGRIPDWSPNGQSLIFIDWLDSTKGGIINFNLNDSLKVLIYNGQGYTIRFPRYSLNGIKIAFTSQPNGGQPQIWIMNSDGSNKSQLTSTGVDATFGLPFSWSPDGSSIVYTDYRSNDWTYDNGTLWILDPVTGGKRQLTFNPKPK